MNKSPVQFMEDVKLCANTEQGLESLVHTALDFSEDIGIHFLGLTNAQN